MTNDLSTQYRRALKTWLAEGGEDALHSAYELGRQALTSDAGLLGLVSIHHAALAALVDECSAARNPVNTHPVDSAQHSRAAGRFLQESLSPFELIHIGNMESNAALQRLNDILEEEAKRIAYSLHDEAAQFLATSYLELAAIRKESTSDSMLGHTDNLKSYLDQMHEQIRQLSHELRSPVLDNLGLLPAIEYLADGFGKRTELTVEVDSRINREKRLPQSIETALYRATQEALSNIARHAQATHVEIRSWTRNYTVFWRIKDDGVGFSVPASDPPHGAVPRRGLGLLGIKERINSLNGSFTIQSAPKTGTELLISIPIKERF